MKRFFSFLVIAALVAILPVAAFGQSGITWDSEIIIQNVGGDTALVTIYYYNNVSSGGGLNKSVDHTIGLGKNIRIYPLDVDPGFNGSVVIESTEPIAVVVNESGNPSTHTYGGVYEGFEMGSSLVRVPGVMSCNASLYTFFNVQNAGAGPTTVTVDFVEEPGKGYASRSNEQCNLNPGESCTFRQEPGQGQWPACSVGGSQWVGGVKITSTNEVPVVAAANLVHQPGTWGMSSYSGFTSEGSPTAILPNAMNANANYWTGIAVTNAGGSATNITIKFFPEQRTEPPFYPAISDVVFNNVQPNDTVIQLMNAHPDLGPTTRWVGSVEVDGGGQNVLVLANTLNTVQGEMSEVKGSDPNSATTTIHTPVLMSDNGSYPWWSGMQLYNTSNSEAHVDVVFSESLESVCGAGTAWTPPPELNRPIPARQSIVLLQSGGDWGGKCYFGSATVTSDGAGILGVVSELAPSYWATGEATLYYNAINR